MKKKSKSKTVVRPAKKKSAPKKKTTARKKSAKLLAAGVPDASASVTLNLNVPPGTIMAYIGSNAPTGWLLCNGVPINRGEYPNLYPLLQGGRLPDLAHRFILGKGAGRNLWATGGSETHKLTTDELPEHEHGFGVGGGGGDKTGGRTGTDDGYSIAYSSAAYKNKTTRTGSNYPHNNMPPFLVLNYIIKW